jgi:hypothetical protein
MNKIVPQFQNSLFSNIADSIPDIAEFGIDSILDEGVLKDFPLMSTLVGVKNVAQNLHDRNLLRQTLAFVKELNNGQLDEKKKEKYKKIIDENPKKAEAELGRVLIILNQNIELSKSKILAAIFQEYINENIDWKTFCEFSEITRMFFVDDIYDLDTIYQQAPNYLSFLSYGADRLVALGLVKSSTAPAIVEDALGIRQSMTLSDIGEKYYKIVSKVLL